MSAKNSILIECFQCAKPISRSPYYLKTRKRHFCNAICKVRYLRDNAEPLMGKLARMTARVDGCLLWNGSRDKDGYGLTSIGHKTVRVSRAVWEHHHGPIPDGLMVMHSCDNPPCSDIDHFSIGSGRQNVQDSMNKGRWHTASHFRRPPGKIARGEASNMSKLTEWDVYAIRIWLRLGANKKEIAKRFGVHWSGIYKLNSGEAWAHVPWPTGTRSE